MRIFTGMLMALLMGAVQAEGPKTRAEYLNHCKLDAQYAALIVEGRYLGRSLADATLSANGDRYLEEIIDIAYSLPPVRDKEEQARQRRQFSDALFSACRK